MTAFTYSSKLQVRLHKSAAKTNDHAEIVHHVIL